METRKRDTRREREKKCMPKQINERTGGEGKRREKKLRPKKKKNDEIEEREEGKREKKKNRYLA